MVKYISELFDYSFEKQLQAQFDEEVVEFVLNDKLFEELDLEYYNEIDGEALHNCAWEFINDLADNRVDIYHYTIRKWAVDNWIYVEEAMVEGLTEGETDYHKLIQIGQYYKIEQDLREDLHYLLEEIKNHTQDFYEQQQIELEL